MKILFLGDIVGRPGREALQDHLVSLKETVKPDITLVNGENAAAGFGITPKICEEFFSLGVDIITLGNHAWDQKQIIPFLEQDKRIIRPLNYPEGTPGRGATLFTTDRGKKVLVLNAMGRIFMDPLDDPFRGTEKELKNYTLGSNVDAIIMDFHGEATSEKNIMGCFLDGRVSMVVGTHSHIPTADARILPGGTAFQTDLGMSGCYDSIIGMEKSAPLARMLKKVPTPRLQVAEGEGSLCGVFVETCDKTGLAQSVRPVRVGPHLINT